MKLIFRTLSLLLCCVLLLASCSKLTTLKFEDEQYKDTKNNVTYLQAPLCYEAVKLVDGGVARVKRSVGEDLVLYAVDGADRKEMLANEQYELFYAEGVTLPKLWEMNVSEVYICQTKLISAQIASVNKAEDVAALIALYQSGAAFPKAKVSMEQSTGHYYLKFVSKDYPAIYYCLEYLEFEEEVLVYERIKDTSSFTPKYTGVEVTYEDHEYVENGETYVEHLAVYHFGTGILYDRAAGVCYPSNGIFDAYMDR